MPYCFWESATASAPAGCRSLVVASFAARHTAWATSAAVVTAVGFPSVAKLPTLLHVRDVGRFSVLVQLVRDESIEEKSGRDLVLERLVELLLIEALRSAPGEGAPPGLLRGLADPRLAIALRHLHGDPARSWTVGELAKKAALSRSAFFERFLRAVGLPPMGYLLGWRMAVAKDLLVRNDFGIAEVAERVGYGSASTFSRYVGQSPGRYARQH